MGTEGVIGEFTVYVSRFCAPSCARMDGFPEFFCTRNPASCEAVGVPAKKHDDGRYMVLTKRGILVVVEVYAGVYTFIVTRYVLSIIGVSAKQLNKTLYTLVMQKKSVLATLLKEVVSEMGDQMTDGDYKVATNYFMQH
jgi:hypothetical protein